MGKLIKSDRTSSSQGWPGNQASFGSPHDLHAAHPPTPDLEGIVGVSAQIRSLKLLVDQAARSDLPVLITGETGTGKELFARRVHRMSDRRQRIFVPINCAALPEGLLESELFGFERGAFTGATERRDGWFMQANGGTVLLDEIGDLGLRAQAKFLRILEHGELQPLGSRVTHRVDFRLIAATNRDLEQLACEGSFRQDLLFRLDVIRVHIPPLRDRPEDIVPIANHFLDALKTTSGRSDIVLSPSARTHLSQQPWFGNARELRNLIERIFLFSERSEITAEDLVRISRSGMRRHASTFEPEAAALQIKANAPSSYYGSRNRPEAYATRTATGSEMERLRSALEQTEWNKSRAAELLHCSRMTVHRKVARYHLYPSEPPHEEKEPV